MNQIIKFKKFSLFMVLAFLVVAVIGCGSQESAPAAVVSAPEIGEPKVGAPAPQQPGEEIGISVDVSSGSGVALNYTWTADGGEIIRGQGSPAITYRVPEESGTYNVRVKIEWDGQSVEKVTSVKVEAEATETPTPEPSTDTPVPPTNTPVPPTDTPFPTPTNTLQPPPSTPTPEPPDTPTPLPPPTPIPPTSTPVDTTTPSIIATPLEFISSADCTQPPWEFTYKVTFYRTNSDTNARITGSSGIDLVNDLANMAVGETKTETYTPRLEEAYPPDSILWLRWAGSDGSEAKFTWNCQTGELVDSTWTPAQTEQSTFASTWTDDFEGSLAPGWNWTNEDATHWSLTEAPGSLRIITQGESLVSSSTSGVAPLNLFLRDAPTNNFEIVTKVSTNPTANFQQSVIVILQDNSNFVKMNRGYVDVEGCCPGSGIYFDLVLNGEMQWDSLANTSFKDNIAYLKLRRKGTTYTGFYSTNGINWVDLGQVIASFTPTKIGITANNAGQDAPPIPADFEYFTIETLP